MITAGKANVWRKPIEVFIKDLERSLFCNFDIVAPIINGRNNLLGRKKTRYSFPQNKYLVLLEMQRKFFPCDFEPLRKFHDLFIRQYV